MALLAMNMIAIEYKFEHKKNEKLNNSVAPFALRMITKEVCIKQKRIES